MAGGEGRGGAYRPLTTSSIWSGEVGGGGGGNQGNYRTQKKSLTINRFLALPYGLGSLYILNHCNRKKGPAQKIV